MRRVGTVKSLRYRLAELKAAVATTASTPHGQNRSHLLLLSPAQTRGFSTLFLLFLFLFWLFWIFLLLFFCLFQHRRPAASADEHRIPQPPGAGSILPHGACPAGYFPLIPFCRKRRGKRKKKTKIQISNQPVINNNRRSKRSNLI